MIEKESLCIAKIETRCAAYRRSALFCRHYKECAGEPLKCVYQFDGECLHAGARRVAILEKVARECGVRHDQRRQV